MGDDERAIQEQFAAVAGIDDERCVDLPIDAQHRLDQAAVDIERDPPPRGTNEPGTPKRIVWWAKSSSTSDEAKNGKPKMPSSREAPPPSDPRKSIEVGDEIVEMRDTDVESRQA